MARYTKALCRQCRRERTKLFLKGERCTTNKCAIERKNYFPGERGQRMTKFSDYGLQLREKQKVKRIYGVLENQFRIYFRDADRSKGITGNVLLQLLECRLDSVVYNLGMATSRNQARQLITHNHFLVNGKKVNVPSFRVKEGNNVGVADKEKSKNIVNKMLSSTEKTGKADLPWLTFDKTKMIGTLNHIPKREEIPLPVKEQLIVELYSK